MSEVIGNALTDEKNTVQLVTADTVITSGNVIASAGGSVVPSSGSDAWGFMIVMFEKDGNLYMASGKRSSTGSGSLSVNCEKITIPT